MGLPTAEKLTSFKLFKGPCEVEPRQAQFQSCLQPRVLHFTCYLQKQPFCRLFGDSKRQPLPTSLPNSHLFAYLSTYIWELLLTQ